ncbi:MAG: SDR family oxidoreductase [Rhodospirillales bacterium]|nr:SDR family oxidoreductase [Rhodospirillales bacterium]
MDLLENRPVVVITGASAGVGRATAIAFARRGYAVGLIARGIERLHEAKADVEAAGGVGLALPADVADASAIEAAAERVEQEFGRIDVWVNCAMATVFSPFAAMSAEEYRRVTEVTYLGQVHGTMTAVGRMRLRDRGTVVNVGSALGYHGLPLQSAYCGAKFAIRGFTESLRAELIHDGSRIRISMVVLPAVNTPQFEWARNKLPMRPQPAPPIYEPEVPAAEIVRAAETGAREILIGRASFKLVFGSILLPGLVDRMLSKMGYSGQQTDEPADPTRPDNLFSPVAGDYAAHGRFDARASGHAIETASFRGILTAAAVGVPLVAAVVGYFLGRRGR